jgi:hypothetical protein
MRDLNALAEKLQFRPLGPITVTSNRSLRFPNPPAGGGLYLIEFSAGGRYIGETALYGKDGTKSGRFYHYTYPADDIWTELVIHEMLLAGGGYVHILSVEGDKRFRQRLEAEKITAFVRAGAQLWNDRAGRCERTYLSWRLPIAERMYALAKDRYETRTELTPYARERLRKLGDTVVRLRAKAKTLGLADSAYTASATIHTLPSQEVETQHAVMERRRPPTQSLGPKLNLPKEPNGESATAIVHRHLAEHPQASLADLQAAVPSWIKPVTSQTLWNDFRMTLDAMGPGTFSPTELRTLTIRRVVCQLWRQDPTQVTKEAVDRCLRDLGRVEKPQTVSALIGNVLSTLRAITRQKGGQGV